MRLVLSQPGSASLRAIDPVPAVNAGFQELTEVRIRVPEGGPWKLQVDDEPLVSQEGEWVWKPGFFAGEVTAELLCPDGSTAATYLLDVSPDATKLGRDRFRALLEEVAREEPGLVVGFEPATLRLGAERPLDDRLEALASFARLRLHVPAFVRAVQEVGRQPRQAMRTARSDVELRRVRRVDVHSLRGLARTPAAALLADSGADAPDPDGGQRVLVDVPVRELAVDCAANRCVVAFLGLVRQDARRVREWLADMQEREEVDETRTSLAARAAYRIGILDKIDADLWRLLRAEPWRLIERPEITAAGLNALAADPRYARVQQLAWKALRRGLGGTAAEERLWISPTWEVFERWCFVRLARLLRTLLSDLTWTRQGSTAGADAAWVGRKEGAKVSLLLQQRFAAWDQPASASFRSVSGLRYPDLVLAVESGATRRFVLLDAKYRQSRPNVLEAMESAHIYRDSLRWHGARPELALLVVPAPPGVPWLADPAFQATERVGAFVLDESLPQLLLEAIGLPAGEPSH